MKLLACHVSNFGTLHEASYDFTDGLNVVLEENGAGKSTLAAFIKAMLYGLTPSRSKNPDENERQRFSPWQGGAFGGWLSFEVQGRHYRVERTFAARPAQDRFKLFDADTGLVSEDYSKNLGEELFGVDASAYERSVWHPQRAVAFSQNTGLAAKLGGGENSADMQQYKGADDALSEYKKRIENMQKRGLLPDARAALEKAKQDAETCRAYLSQEKSVREQAASLAAAIEEKKQELSVTRDALSQALAARERLARLETWRMFSSRRDETQKALAALEAQFPNGVPEEGQLSGAARLIAQAQQARTQAAGAMALSDITRLAHLTEKFPSGAPSQEQLSAWLKDAGRVDETFARVESERARIVTARASLGDGFEQGVPSQSACDEAQDAAVQAQLRMHAMRRGDEQNDGANKKVRVAAFAASGALLALGAVCFLFSSAAAVALLILGAALLTASVLAFRKQDRAHAQMDDFYRQETDATLKKCDDFLARYEGTQTDAHAPRTLRVQQVAARARRYEQLAQELIALDERARKNDEHAAMLSRTLSQMQQDTQQGYAQAVMALSQAAAQYRTLCAARDESRRRMAESSAQAKQLEGQIDAFFTRYGADRTLDAEEALSRMRTRAAQVRAAAQEARRARAALAEYEQTQDVRALSQAAAPEGLSPEQLREREKSLSDELVSLESERNLAKKEADDLSEYAERLQLLQAECGRLQETCADLETQYRITSQTQAFLSRAYDALRAGYLSILRQGLRKYAAVVTGRDESVLDVDADLSVSAMVQGQSRAYAHFSRGQRDVLDICMRLALCDALFEGEQPFLVLDDPFANLDDENVARARALVEKLAQDRQILYLACHSSRA